MLTNFYNIWHTVYWSNFQHNNVHLTCVLLLHYLGKYSLLVLDHLGWFVPSTKLFKWLRNVTMKSDQWKISHCYILPWCWAECWCKRCFVHLCHYCDADISQQGSVPAHWCVHQTVELLQRETPKFTGPGLWPPNKPVWMKEKVIVIFELWWRVIVFKNWIFSVCGTAIFNIC